MDSIFNFLLHLDRYLAGFAQAHGPWAYGLLFAIIFAETGLVVTPFLPGDTLVFVAGALAGGGVLDVPAASSTLAIAAFVGNTTNYIIGRYFGHYLFAHNRRWINQRHLQQTHAFFERHGGKTIILARFLPIVRTLAPFVAGVGQMSFARFTLYNLTGAVLWVATVFTVGYFFGNLPFVHNHLTEFILGLVLLSLVPAALGYWRHHRHPRSQERGDA